MSGQFTYEYGLGEESLDLDVTWEQTGSARRATQLDPPEYNEVEIDIKLAGATFMPDKDTYVAITEQAYAELEAEQEAAAGMDEDAEYERRRQRMIDDD